MEAISDVDELIATRNTFCPLDIVWASLNEYPTGTWPAIICHDPEQNQYERDSKLHVLFFETPPSRAWVSLLGVRLLMASDTASGEGVWSRQLTRALRQAKDALASSEEQRGKLISKLFRAESESDEEDSNSTSFPLDNYSRDPDWSDSVSEEEEEKNKKVDNDEATRKRGRRKTVKMNENDDEDISEYEKMRLRNIKEREELFQKLCISQSKDELVGIVRKRGPNKKRMSDGDPVPVKRSLRLQAANSNDDKLSMEMVPGPSSKAGFRLRMPLTTLTAKDVAIRGDVVDYWRNPDADISHTGRSSADHCQNPKISQGRLQLQKHGIAKIVDETITSLSVHSCSANLLVAAGDLSGKLGLWNVQHAKTKSRGVHTFQPQTENISSLEFSNFYSNKLYSSSFDGTFRCYDMESCSFQLIYGNPHLYEETTFHHELDSNTFLLAMGSAGSVGLVDTRLSNSRVSNTYQLFDDDFVGSVDVHPLNRNHMLCSTQGGKCSVFDIRVWPRHGRRKKPVMTLGGHQTSINSACYSPLAGTCICTVATDGIIRLFRTETVLGSAEVMPQATVRHSSQDMASLIKASWHPRRDDLFAVASLESSEVKFYSDLGHIYHSLYLKTNLPTLRFHSSLNVMVGGSNSGRAYLFSDNY